MVGFPKKKRINGRLAGWKRNLLSRSSRVTLVKSVVTACLFILCKTFGF